MTPLKCDLCGSTSFIKDGEFFVCQHCKTKYTIEAAQKMMGTVKIDNSDELNNLLTLLRTAWNSNDIGRVETYSKEILKKCSINWEARLSELLYEIVAKKKSNQSYDVDKVFRTLNDSINIICKEYSSVEDRIVELNRLFVMVSIADKIIRQHEYNSKLSNNLRMDMSSWKDYLTSLPNVCINAFEKQFADNIKMYKQVGVNLLEWKISTTPIATEEEYNALKSKISRYDPSYSAPPRRPVRESIGRKQPACYVATCVYGSYDCSQVRILRRYRDIVLNSSWYGRSFIKAYYGISPVVVHYFGNSNWFHKLWRPFLDVRVKKLQAKGFDDSPYIDK